jgi:hypothetical protein
MSKTDIDYYEWLISQIYIRNDKSYRGLFERMHNMEFVWTVPNDNNRIQDGLDLRYEFLNGTRNKLTLNGATFLEVLIALSRRVAFTAGGEANLWAWKLMKNIKLNKMSDPLTDEKASRIDVILYNLIWRIYDKNGRGGFFPLNHTLEDQTKVEIWYQMQAYVNESQAF